jgi:hypothetical protein
MIRTLLTVVILWVLVAFNWNNFIKYVDEYKLVDKTTQIVYNIKRSVTNNE